METAEICRHSGAGLPFGRFDGQIPQFWPFFKAVGRRKLIWPKR